MSGAAGYSQSMSTPSKLLLTMKLAMFLAMTSRFWLRTPARKMPYVPGLSRSVRGQSLFLGCLCEQRAAECATYSVEKVQPPKDRIFLTPVSCLK